MPYKDENKRRAYQRAYQQEWLKTHPRSPKEKQPPEPPRPADCHPDRVHYAHGLCRRCYRLERGEIRERLGRTHATCHPERYSVSRGLCQRCYATAYRRGEITDKIPTCHPERPEYAKGLCSACYQSNFRSPEANRKRSLRKRYGADTPDWYAQKFEEQGGLCAVCGKPPTGASHSRKHLVVDHNHETNEKRELLCQECNRAIGLLGDTPDSLASGLLYLIKHGKTLSPEKQRELVSFFSPVVH